jgi:hypothetical protein
LYGCSFLLGQAYTTLQGFLAFFALLILRGLSCVSAEPRVLPAPAFTRYQSSYARKVMIRFLACYWQLPAARHFLPSKTRHFLLCSTCLVCFLTFIVSDSSTCSQFRYDGLGVMNGLGLIRLHTAFFWDVCISVTCTRLPWSRLPSRCKRGGRSPKCVLSHNSGKAQRTSILDSICLCDPRDAHCVTSYDHGNFFFGTTAREYALFSSVGVVFFRDVRLYLLASFQGTHGAYV